MKSIKICVSTILALLAVLCMSIGFLTVNTAKADEADITGTPAVAAESATFAVKNGAYVRLENDTNGAYGIRFEATVGDVVEGATYKMAVVPTELIDLYDADTSESKANIIDWLTSYADSKSGSIATAKCEVNNGKISVALTDIYWVNLNRKFSAIAYYVKDDEKVIAGLANDGSRSIADVVTAASEDTTATYTEDEQTAIETLTTECNQQAENIVVSSTDASAISIYNTKDSEGKDVINWEGSVEHVDNYDDKGNAWQITLTKKNVYDHAQLKWDTEKYANRLKGYDTVEFSVYTSSTSADDALYILSAPNWGVSASVTKSLETGWNDFTVSASDFQNTPYFLMIWPRVNEPYYITDFRAYTAKETTEEKIQEMANEVSALIDALPKAESLEEIDKVKISAARTSYNALPKAAKDSVTNYATLTALETAYNNKYKVVFDMKNIDGFKVNHDGYGNGDAVTLSKGTDDTYGNYLSASISNKTHDHIAISYSNEGLSTLLDCCDKIYFYVYNGNTDALGLFWNFGGTLNGWAKTLPAGAWTLVEASASDFIKGSYFGILNAPDDTQYKFSMFYTTRISAEEAAKTVTDKIVALPSVEDLEGIDKVKISAARTAYDELSEEAKALVTNYDKLTDLETAYAAKFVVVYDMSDISQFSVSSSSWGNGDCTTFSKGYDSEKGNYLNVQLTNATDGNLVIKYNGTDLSSKLAGCDKVYFYVYNGGANGRPLITSTSQIDSGYTSLKNGEWIPQEVTIDKFSENFGFIWTEGVTETYKFSMFWATKTAE